MLRRSNEAYRAVCWGVLGVQRWVLARAGRRSFRRGEDMGEPATNRRKLPDHCDQVQRKVQLMATLRLDPAQARKKVTIGQVLLSRNDLQAQNSQHVFIAIRSYPDQAL